MTPEYFVLKLKEVSPTKEILAANGFGDEEITQIMKSYACAPRADHINASSDTLLRLLSAYDCSNLEVGLIRFKEEVVEEVAYYIVGEVEADILGISKTTKEVCVLDHTISEHVVSFCASNSDAFLDALLSFASFLYQRLKNDTLFANTAFTKHWVHVCADKAGGEKYLDFYKMLLGDFEL
jgi:hypothetical protein